jgi:hypothetical protein
MIKTMAMGFLFAPLTPIVWLFTAVALYLHYMGAKYCILYYYRLPPAFSDRLQLAVKRQVLIFTCAYPTMMLCVNLSNTYGDMPGTSFYDNQGAV